MLQTNRRYRIIGLARARLAQFSSNIWWPKPYPLPPVSAPTLGTPTPATRRRLLRNPSDAAPAAPRGFLCPCSHHHRRGDESRASCSPASPPLPSSTELAPAASSASEETSTRPTPGAQFLVVSFSSNDHPPPGMHALLFPCCYNEHLYHNSTYLAICVRI